MALSTDRPSVQTSTTSPATGAALVAKADRPGEQRQRAHDHGERVSDAQGFQIAQAALARLHFPGDRAVETPVFARNARRKPAPAACWR